MNARDVGAAFAARLNRTLTPPTLVALLRRRSNIAGAILRREAADLMADCDERMPCLLRVERLIHRLYALTAELHEQLDAITVEAVSHVTPRLVRPSELAPLLRRRPR